MNTVSILARAEARALHLVAACLDGFVVVSILARAEARALLSAHNAMTINVEKRTLREPSVFVQQRVRTAKRRR
jgi:hypothetical protein